MTVTHLTKSKKTLNKFDSLAKVKKRSWPPLLPYYENVRWSLVGHVFEAMVLSLLLKKLYRDRPLSFYNQRVFNRYKDFPSAKKFIKGKTKVINRKKLTKEIFKKRFKTTPRKSELKVVDLLYIDKKSLKRLSHNIELQIGTGDRHFRGVVDILDLDNGWVVDVKFFYPPRIDVASALQVHIYRELLQSNGYRIKNVFLFLEGIGLKEVKMKKKRVETSKLKRIYIESKRDSKKKS